MTLSSTRCSALLMCQHMIRRRLKRGGVIINIGSIEAILPFAEDLVPYDISTKAVAKEVARFKVGLLKTGVQFATRLPLRRGGQPDEVARIAVVLASDLSSYVHGALIPVDGGFLSA